MVLLLPEVAKNILSQPLKLHLQFFNSRKLLINHGWLTSYAVIEEFYYIP